MSWLLKYLGWKAIKALIKKFVVNTLVKPSIHKVRLWIQEYIDDPDTQADEKFLNAFEEFANYYIEKRIK